MHVYYKFGLLLIFILSVRYSKALPTSTQNNIADYDQYDDYEDYYEDDDNSTQPPSTTKKPASKPLLADFFDSALSESNQSMDTLDLPKRSNELPKCPADCICRDDNKNIICIAMDLTTIPTDIPPTALTLDLSHNNISEIPPGAFSNNTNLRDINLSFNILKNLDKEIFVSLPKLERLSLANNKLSDISPDTFSDAYKLSALNLNNNTIVIPKEGSFLHQPALHELFLRNCSLTEIYDETFANLSSLNTLKMDLNYFSKKINTKAFEPLKELIKLKLPELEQSNIQELCNVLQSIDNISLKRFDISCYELVNGNSFNESLILATDAPVLKPTTTTTAKPVRKPTKSTTAGSTQVIKSVVKPAVMTYSNEQSSNLTDSKIAEAGIGGAAMGALSTELPMLNSTTTTTEKAYQVPISKEAINYSLISIIIIAVIGLIIGFICRKDVGGIKTKCCRTRKPPPGDQVRPAEEIPLNKIG